MQSVVCGVKVHHTIKASERCSSALVSMLIELLLGQDISTCLGRTNTKRQLSDSRQSYSTSNPSQLTSQEKETMTGYVLAMWLGSND